jgi:hypothetical protein
MARQADSRLLQPSPNHGDLPGLMRGTHAARPGLQTAAAGRSAPISTASQSLSINLISRARATASDRVRHRSVAINRLTCISIVRGLKRSVRAISLSVPPRATWARICRWRGVSPPCWRRSSAALKACGASSARRFVASCKNGVAPSEWKRSMAARRCWMADPVLVWRASASPSRLKVQARQNGSGKPSASSSARANSRAALRGSAGDELALAHR